MRRTSTFAKIGKHTIELSNLEKVLFPAGGIIKAELIEYYLKIAPSILRHIKGRALSFVRFPDGVEGESFFQKNRQDWAPPWIQKVTLGETDKIDYILATEDATLAWVANLACIEIHQMHSRAPHFDKPDYIVFDIDPPEKFPFPRVVELSLDLKEHIESYGYATFVKTTGGKGAHIVTPVEPNWTFEACRDAAFQIAKAFIERNGELATLQIKKAARKGKVLIDVYRNSTYQTIVSPYSLRGNRTASVSMPLTWDAFAAVTDPAEFNLRTAPDYVVEHGDPWEAIGAYAAKLHTMRPKTRPTRKPTKKTRDNDEKPLTEYTRKRSFNKTPEPGPVVMAGDGNTFVVHRHHASRLHYDLRIERDGVLKCWAVPKGLPPRPGIKRMAAQTEDHPMKYLDFEGVIPKGEYGAGPMWVFARGKYEITKEKRDSIYLRLQSLGLNAEYRIINTKEKDWLVERIDAPQLDWLTHPVDFMLAQSQDSPFDSPDFLYEVKWDGIRAFVVVDEGKITIRSRSQRDITNQFPELLNADQAFRATSGLFDAEIVSLDEKGVPVFHDVLQRLHPRNEAAIERGRLKHPAVCYLFDCLYLDGRPIVNEPLERRRAWLSDSVKKNAAYRVSETFDEGRRLFEAVSKMGLEGIVAKQRLSVYLPGKRTSEWIKIKTRRTVDCIILGYTKGKGEREPTFGALQLGCYKNGDLVYIGKVGTGFDERMRKSIFTNLAKLERVERRVAEKPIDDSQTIWLEPEIICEVQYASIVKGHLREPVFLRLRPDLSLEDCQMS